METKEYEFDNTQNQLIDSLAKRMRFVGIFIMVAGIIIVATGIYALPAGIANIIEGVIYLIIGFWTNKAASSFKLIVGTEGSDIMNLMEALGRLKKLYTLQYGILIAVIVLLVIAFLIGIAGGIAGST